MEKLKTWLNRAYPFAGSWKYHLRYAGYAGLFVTLFLAVFRPFGINISEGDYWMNMLFFAGFGLITAVSLVIFGGLTMLFPVFFNEKEWTVGREVIANFMSISLIAVANMFFGLLIWEGGLSWGLFFQWMKMTFLVALGPIFITVFIKQNRLNAVHTQGAEKLNAHLKVVHTERKMALTLSGDNQGETLSLLPSDLLYLEASDNYVRVFYENGKAALENTLLRSTLKKMEKQLSTHPQFFRCHRTYLVNLNRVEHVSGNAQGYKLHLLGTNILVPVSRRLNEEIDRRLS